MLKYWGHLKIINFPFVPNGKFIIFRCPKIWANYNLIIMCSNVGTPNNHHFLSGTSGEVVVFGVPILKHFRVNKSQLPIVLYDNAYTSTKYISPYIVVYFVKVFAIATRVAMVREKYLENEIFFQVREKSEFCGWPGKFGKSGKSQRI